MPVAVAVAVAVTMTFGVEAFARFRRDPGGIEVVDVVGDHLHPVLADCVEELRVRGEADPLIPRVVSRGEVRVDVVTLRQSGDRRLAQEPLHQARSPVRQPPEQHLDHCDPEPRHGVSSFGGEELTGERSTGVDLRQREHVAGRALQHGHLRCLPRQCGDHRHGGGAAADHHHGLAGVIQVLGPVLGVYDGAGELRGAGEVGV